MAGVRTITVDWEALGTSAAASLNAVHAVVVLGVDPLAVARVAIGIARAESRTRRVAIGDLIGDAQPIQQLVSGDDPHGLVDSFLYGVSLNKIARQVDESGALFVMPTGTEDRVPPEIMRHGRWSRLAAGFREVGALLILVARSDAEGVRELTELVDGAVIVGEHPYLPVSRESVLALVEAPAPAPAPVADIAAPAVEPVLATNGSARPVKPVSPVLLPPRDASDANMPVVFPKKRERPIGLIAAGIALMAAVGAGAWYMVGRTPAAPGADPTKSVQQGPVPTPDSVTATEPTTIDTTIAQSLDSLAMLRPANPEDSARTSPYSVVVLATNDEAAALARWADLGLKLPAGTVSMARIRGERGRFYQMQAGAYTKASQADSMLNSLRTTGKIGPEAGRVVATPYALMLEDKVSRRAAQNVADAYGQREIAAYALVQADNTATIYVGAFESPEQAVALMTELKAKGVTATLAYRTGRSL